MCLLCHDAFTQAVTAWILDQAPLGFKAPRQGFPRMKWCPVCDYGQQEQKLTAQHVLFTCEPIGPLREELGVSEFLHRCHSVGIAAPNAFALFVNGRNPDNSDANKAGVRKRGAVLLAIQDYWLNLWPK